MFLPRGVPKLVNACFHQEVLPNSLADVLSKKVLPNSLMGAVTRFF